MIRQEQIATIIFETEKKNGLITTLGAVFGESFKVRLPLSKKALETSLDEIDFSVRAANSLKRAKIFSVGDVVKSIEDGSISSIRNLGKKTKTEIVTKLLLYGYEKLNSKEKLAFFRDIVYENIK